VEWLEEYATDIREVRTFTCNAQAEMEDDGSSGDSNRSTGSPSSLDDHDHISLAPSSASSTSRGGHDKDLSPEAKHFLSDLNNYLGIGCLIFQDLITADEHHETGQWHEVSQLPLLAAFSGSLYSHVQSLLSARWIRVLWSRSVGHESYQIYRIYVLPLDVGLRYVDRHSKKLFSALEGLISELEVSQRTWCGRYDATTSQKFDPWATSEEGSLFWLFNKIPSPAPIAAKVEATYAREALEDLLDPISALPGLKTPLYPYQRRSTGLMLQRESTSSLELDPRLEQRIAPDGSIFYYCARDSLILRHPRYYEACKGGVLAETMGLGKTLMCLALILATKHHYPKIPPAWNSTRTRPSIGSLTAMAVAAINRKSVPWRVEFERIRHATGHDMSRCRDKLECEPASYEIPLQPQRWNRNTIIPPPVKMTLTATTLVVVPRNLLQQWRSEIWKHVEEGALNMLVMDNSKKPLPAADE